MKFTVELPVSGTASCSVEAESEEEAIQKALIGENEDPPELVEWEALEHIVTGNVFHGMIDDPEAWEE